MIRGIVDAHVHVGLHKYRPVEEYVTAMDNAGVQHAVLVQYVGSTDNSYLRRCVRQHPHRFVAIGMVDSRNPDAVASVDALAAAGFLGIRLWATTRSSGADPLAIWRAIALNGLVASVRGPFTAIVHPDFAAIIAELPTLQIRLEHLGFFRYSVDTGFEQFLNLAQWPNVYTVWSGFYANSREAYPHPDAGPYLRASLDAFGPRRVMWSGDWNRDDLPAAQSDKRYPDAIRHVNDHMQFLTDADREWVLSRTAARLFGWSDAQ